MEQIIKTIINSERPIELGLLVVLIIGVSAIFLYTKTLRKAAKNDYHTLPEHTEAIRNELVLLRQDNNAAHNKTIEILAEIRGKIK